MARGLDDTRELFCGHPILLWSTFQPRERELEVTKQVKVIATSPRSMWLEDYFGEKRANSCIFGEDNENSASRRDHSTVVRGQC